MAAGWTGSAPTPARSSPTCGKRVPGDVAVIGFDATEHGAYWDPPLTSVRVDAEAFGRRAARQALGLDASDVVPGPATVVAGGTA